MKLFNITADLSMPCRPGHWLKPTSKKAKRSSKKCKACHQVGEKAKSRTGPILNNLWGRTAAAEESFKTKKILQSAQKKRRGRADLE